MRIDLLQEGQECPECEEGLLKWGHLIDAERTPNLIEDYRRQRELDETRCLYCPDCWNFWHFGDL